jgi:flagellar biosynthesis/type III secretory pathway protein FliH
VRDLNAMIGAGWDEGKAAGIEIGRSEGIAEGKAVGKAEGIAVGKAEGKAVGKAEGKAKLLERLLTKKFGALSEPSRSRLLSATDAELNAWSEALLVATTLEEVLQ